MSVGAVSGKVCLNRWMPCPRLGVGMEFPPDVSVPGINFPIRAVTTMTETPPQSDFSFVKMTMIDDAMFALSHHLRTINKWEGVALEEFKVLEQELESKYPNGFPTDYDPLVDAAFIRHHTGLALYGSLAVAISAKVEDLLPDILDWFGVKNILKDGQAHKTATKPGFGDYLFTFEQKCGCKRKDIAHYEDHLFVRELANRFKHSGGKSTKEFVTQYGTVASVDAPDQDITFDQQDWPSRIKQTEALLVDVVARISKVNPSPQPANDAMPIRRLG